MSNPVLDAIKTRRVIREVTDEPVERAQIEQILEAARWAPVGGNLRVHRFVVVQNPTTLRTLRMVSPGMFQRPPVVIVICIDWEAVASHQMAETNRALYTDVGMAALNMMLAAYSLGLGSGPVTSFSKEAVRVVLNLPDNLTPEMFVCIGHPAPIKHSGMRPHGKITWQSLTFWERFEEVK